MKSRNIDKMINIYNNLKTMINLQNCEKGFFVTRCGHMLHRAHGFGQGRRIGSRHRHVCSWLMVQAWKQSN